MPRNAHGRPAEESLQLSVVVPLFNEVATVTELHRRIRAVLFGLGVPAEVIDVDDGSSDGTSETLASLAARDAAIPSPEPGRCRRDTGGARDRCRWRSRGSDRDDTRGLALAQRCQGRPTS